MTRYVLLPAAVAATLVLVACDKQGGAPPGPDVAASAPSASASGARTPPPPSASAVVNDTPAAWSGHYTSAPGTLYVYDGGEWKGVHFRGDDASTGLGDGTLSIIVDPKTGALRGTGAGALGETVLTGAVTGNEVSFSVLRKDARDHGLTGTGVGTMKGSSISGLMHLSQGDAHVIRTAKFDLAKSSP